MLAWRFIHIFNSLFFWRFDIKIVQNVSYFYCRPLVSEKKKQFLNSLRIVLKTSFIMKQVVVNCRKYQIRKLLKALIISYKLLYNFAFVGFYYKKLVIYYLLFKILCISSH